MEFEIIEGPFNNNPGHKLIFKFKNNNYCYNTNNIRQYRIEEIFGIWDDLNEIFLFCHTYKKKSFKLNDINKIDDHFFYNNELYYISQPRNCENSVYLRLSDCFSHYLFKLIRDYLIIDIKNKTSNIADYTKYTEINKYYIMFKCQLNNQISVLDSIETLRN